MEQQTTDHETTLWEAQAYLHGIEGFMKPAPQEIEPRHALALLTLPSLDVPAK